jgi:hypothetical protein
MISMPFLNVKLKKHTIRDELKEILKVFLWLVGILTLFWNPRKPIFSHPTANPKALNKTCVKRKRSTNILKINFV